MGANYRRLSNAQGLTGAAGRARGVAREPSGQRPTVGPVPAEVPAVAAPVDTAADPELGCRLLLDAYAQAVWETDANGLVVQDSPSWRAYTGQTFEEWVGKGWVNAIHPDDRACAERNWSEAVAAQRNVDGEFRLRCADGTWRWTNVRAAPLRAPDGSVRKWVGMNVDIHAKKLGEEALREREARQRFLLRLSDALRPLGDPGRIRQEASRVLREYLGAGRVIYTEAVGEGEVEVVATSSATPGPDDLGGRLRLDDYGAALASEFLEGRPTWRDDVGSDPGFGRAARARYAASGIAAWANVPLVKDGRLVAMLSTHFAQPHAWTDAELAVVSEVAERTWDAVERARAEAAQAADLRAMQRLRDLGARPTPESDVQVLYDEIVAVAMALANADAGTLQILDETSGYLTMLATRGFGASMTGRFAQVSAASTTSCGRALRTGTRVYTDFDVPPEDDPDGALRAHADMGLATGQSTPLVSRTGRQIGMLSTHWHRRWRLSERESRFLDLLARQAADLIDGQQAHEGLLRSEARVRRALSIETVGVIFFTLDGRITDANAAFERMSGYTRDELRARTRWEALTPPEFLDVTRAAASELEARGETSPYEKQLLRKDGTRWWGLFAPTRLGGDDHGLDCVEFVIDVTERRLAEESLRESEERFRLLADQAPIMVWVTDADGGISFVNGEYCRFFGLTLDQVRGDAWRHLLHPEDGAYMADAIEATRTRSAFRGEARVKRAGGDWRWISSHATPRWTSDGQFLGMIGVSFDVTDVKGAADLQAEAARQKDAFIAVLAHELRNPLAPLRMSVGLLQARGGDDPVVVQCRDVIERQVAQMARLLDDLLDVSRLSQGRLTLQRDEIVLGDVLDAAIETVRPLFSRAGHSLVLEVLAEPIRLHADAVRLVQVFGNLLNNAAKFTDAGGQVRIAVQRGEGTATVRITDNGIGIPEAMLGRVFDLFTQAGPAQRSSGGLGIGLALARQLVEMHGGVLRCESEGPGKGSTFTVTLPADPAAQLDLPLAATAPAAPIACRVLVVDDNRDAAEMTTMLLEQHGCAARPAYSGEEAIREAAAFRPDVVLLDIGMPGMDGLETCRRMRAEPWGRQLTIVALTGWGQEEDRRRSERYGFDGHLVKPVEPAVLMTLVGERVRRDAE